MVDKRARNVLQIASELDNKRMVKFISRNCPVINNLLGQKNNDGNTPLHVLALPGCPMFEIVYNKMADKEALTTKN